MLNTKTNNVNNGESTVQIQDNNPTFQNPSVIRMEPIEPLKHESVQPTASFAVDIRTDFKGPPLMGTNYTLFFRPAEDWKGKEYGFDWLRIGDSGQWNDKKEDDHLVKRIGKYYKKGTFKINEQGGVTGNQQIVVKCRFRAEISKSGNFVIDNKGKSADNNGEILVWLEGSGYAQYLKYEFPHKKPNPLLPTPVTNEKLFNSDKYYLITVVASATVKGILHGTFLGNDDGVNSAPTPSISGIFSGNITNSQPDNKPLTVELNGELITQTSDLGYYGSDPNDYRYMSIIPAEERKYFLPSGEINEKRFEPNTSFVAMPALYKKMVRENFPISFAVLWKLREQKSSHTQPPTNPIDYEIYKSKLIYSVPILFIRNTKTAKLKIRPERDPSIPYRPIRIDFRERNPDENNFTIPSYTGNMDNGGVIKITCNKQFADFKYIDAIAIYDKPDDPRSSDKIEIKCGQIRVHPNNVIRRINIVLVSIKINNKKSAVPKENSQEIKFLRNVYEEQAMLDIRISPPKNLTMSSEMELSHKNLCDEFEAANPNINSNFIKVFYVPGGGTCNTDYNRRSIILFDENSLYDTLAHEMGHALSLPHSFTCKEAADWVREEYRTGKEIDPNVNAEYTYQGRMTENIMDYSHVENELFLAAEGSSTGGTPGKRFALYYWQIRKIWQDVDRLNGGVAPPIPKEVSNEETTNYSYDLYEFRSKARI